MTNLNGQNSLKILITKTMLNTTFIGNTVEELLNKFLNVIEPIDLIQVLQNDIGDELLKFQVKYKESIIIDSLKIPRSLYIVAICYRLNYLISIHGWAIMQEYGVIYLYNGYYWIRTEVDQIKKFLGSASESMGYYSPADTRTAQFAETIYKQFLISSDIPNRSLSKSKVLINLRNGTYDVENGNLRDHQAKDYMMYCLPYDYNPLDRCPLYLKYLNHVLPEKNTQLVLQEFHGYIFMDLKLEKALILYGKGANGKSVQFEITRALLGEKNVSTKTLGDLLDMDMGNDSRAKLKNKLVNFGSEIRANKMDSDIFKRLVSGEPVAAREKYKTSFDLENTCKFIFNANELPATTEYTESFFRRFLIIPYNQFISDNERDPELHSKIIEKELSGILNWVILGLNRLTQQKYFTYSQAVEETLSTYKKESNSIIHFIEESNLKKSQNNRISTAMLYSSYLHFCELNSLNYHKKTEFSKMMKILNFENYRTSNERGFCVEFQK